MNGSGSDLQEKIVNILNKINALKKQTDVENALIKEINDKLTNLLESGTSTFEIKTSTTQYTYDTSNKVKTDPTELEKEVIGLNQRIAELEDINKAYIEKNELLKTALLLHIDTETADMTDTSIKPTTIPIPETAKKPAENVITIEDAMKAQQANSQNFPEPQFEPEIATPIEPEIPIPPPPKIEPISETGPSDEKRVCPICENALNELILEEFDEVGRKLKCGKCGYTWR
jgi:ribosomal protein S27AE